MKGCFTKFHRWLMHLFDTRILSHSIQHEKQKVEKILHYTLAYDPQTARIPVLVPVDQKRFHVKRHKLRHRPRNLDSCCHGITGGCRRIH
jgi:hypothetical protein